MNERTIFPQAREIASDEEWEYIRHLLVDLSADDLNSSFKISRKTYPELKHSFFYFKQGNADPLVSLARGYYLGQGSYGRVKIAEDAEGKKYALKVVSGSVKNEEVTTLRQKGYLLFAGPRRDFPSFEPRLRKYYLLQKYMKGITVLEYLTSTQLSDEQKQVLAIKVLHAVKSLHVKEQMAHNDIKSNNMMISVDKNSQVKIKLIDFGLSRSLTSNVITSINGDIYFLGIMFRDEFNLKLPIIDIMCEASSASAVIEIDKIIEGFYCMESDEVELPTPASKLRLITYYKIGEAESIVSTKNFLLAHLERLARQHHITLVKKDGGNYSMIFNSKNPDVRTIDAKNVSPARFIAHKYKQASLYELLQVISALNKEYKKSFADFETLKIRIKENLVDLISYAVKLTNDIEELNEFYNYLRRQEHMQPMLRLERTLFMGKAGMTNSWKEALLHIKDRALQLAEEEINLHKIIRHPESYQALLDEKRARIFKLGSTRLKQFNQLILPKPIRPM